MAVKDIAAGQPNEQAAVPKPGHTEATVPKHKYAPAMTDSSPGRLNRFRAAGPNRQANPGQLRCPVGRGERGPPGVTMH